MIAKFKLVAVVAILSVASACGAATKHGPRESARPALLARLADGRRLNFRCSGAGRLTIIFESGFGGDSLAWSRVRALLGNRYRVCAYDRAGAGFSDPAPQPRDGAAIARDLDQGLHALRIGGPLILVGHSSGGLYVRVFAGLRAQDVAGLVLVDPSAPYQDRRMAERFGAGAGSVQSLIDRSARCLDAARASALPSQDPALKACTPAPGIDPTLDAAQLALARSPGKWLDQISELETLWTSTSAEAVATDAVLRDKPLVVLTADGTYAGNSAAARAAIDSFWSMLHQEMAALSSRGREERVARSSHLMMFDRPDAIVAAIDDVAAQAASVDPNKPRGGTER